MKKYEKELADYVSVLEKSSRETHRAEDRIRYQQHLASAALMFVAIVKDESLSKLKELVAAERHSYGWDYLSEAAGAEAEEAYNTFATMVEKDTMT